MAAQSLVIRASRDNSSHGPRMKPCVADVLLTMSANAETDVQQPQDAIEGPGQVNRARVSGRRHRPDSSRVVIRSRRAKGVELGDKDSNLSSRQIHLARIIHD